MSIHRHESTSSPLRNLTPSGHHITTATNRVHTPAWIGQWTLRYSSSFTAQPPPPAAQLATPGFLVLNFLAPLLTVVFTASTPWTFDCFPGPDFCYVPKLMVL